MARRVSIKALRGLAASRKAPPHLRAWAIKKLRSGGSTPRSSRRHRPQTINRHRNINTSMARRHRFSKRRSHRSSSSNAKQELIGAFVWGAIGENIIDSVAGNNQLLGLSSDMIKLGAGYYLRNKGGIVGGAAKAAMIVSVYKLSKGGLGSLGNLFGGSTTTSATTSGATF